MIAQASGLKKESKEEYEQQREREKRDVENLEMLQKFKQQVLEQESRLAD
jgi:hypothetical protein